MSDAPPGYYDSQNDPPAYNTNTTVQATIVSSPPSNNLPQPVNASPVMTQPVYIQNTGYNGNTQTVYSNNMTTQQPGVQTVYGPSDPGLVTGPAYAPNEKPPSDHCAHLLLCIFTNGFSLPCWLFACAGVCCESPCGDPGCR